MERTFLDSGVAIWRVSSFQEYIQQRTKITNQLNNTSCDSGKLTFKQKQLHSDNPAKHCLIYFDRIMNKGYQPNLDDILNLKDPTIGMTETMFRRKEFAITLIDVGGQRSERKKWLHYFEGVDLVVFVVAMSEYDQALLENTKVNRMHESLQVFDSVCNNKWFF